MHAMLFEMSQYSGYVQKMAKKPLNSTTTDCLTGAKTQKSAVPTDSARNAAVYGETGIKAWKY